LDEERIWRIALTGKKPSEVIMIECPNCMGSGSEAAEVADDCSLLEHEARCSICDGTGFVERVLEPLSLADLLFE